MRCVSVVLVSPESECLIDFFTGVKPPTLLFGALAVHAPKTYPYPRTYHTDVEDSVVYCRAQIPRQTMSRNRFPLRARQNRDTELREKVPQPLILDASFCDISRSVDDFPEWRECALNQRGGTGSSASSLMVSRPPCTSRKLDLTPARQ